jgi:drug/metabolite transporter (DMT)-like permease
MPEISKPVFFRSLRFRYGLGLLVFLAAAGFFLWEEHEAHILGYLPLILILGVCLGMHFLMHGGHGGGHHDDGPPRQGRK